LELVPKKFQSHKSCKKVYSRFGIPPSEQILDDNYHHEILQSMSESIKRGRPDVVHFALLDVASTPLYLEDMIQVLIHTVGDVTIKLKSGVRVPRTTQRFCGVISSLLTDVIEGENALFEVSKEQSISKLMSGLEPAKVILLSRIGKSSNLRDFIEQGKYLESGKGVVWMVGGFPHGHFEQRLVEMSDEMIAISQSALPAHVVTARLSYELELKMGKNWKN